MHTDIQAYASQVVMSWGGLAEQLVPANVGQQSQLAYHSILQVHPPCLFLYLQWTFHVKPDFVTSHVLHLAQNLQGFQLSPCPPFAHCFGYLLSGTCLTVSGSFGLMQLLCRETATLPLLHESVSVLLLCVMTHGHKRSPACCWAESPTPQFNSMSNHCLGFCKRLSAL